MSLRSVGVGTVRNILAKAASARPDPIERGKWRVSGRDPAGRPVDVVVSMVHDPMAVVTVIRTDVKEDVRRNPRRQRPKERTVKKKKSMHPSVLELAFLR